MSSLSPNDPSSFSRPEIAVIKHISLKLNVEFGKKVLHGDALLNIDVLENTDEVILDIRNQTIQSIELDDGTKLKYDISDEVPNFGSKLTVNIPGKAGDNFQSFFPRRSGARHTSLSTKRSQCCSNAQDCKPGFQSEACCKGCLAAPILNTFPQENEYEKKSNDHLNFIKFGLEYIKKLKRHNTCVASESRKKQRGEKRSRSSKTNERKMNNVRDNKNNNDNEETVRLPKKFPRVEDENISIRSFPRTPIPVTKCKQTHKKGTEGKKIDRRDCKDKDVNISDLKDKTEASSVKIKVHIYHSARAKRNTQKKRDKLRKLIRAECASVQQNEEDFDVKPSVETSPKERAVQCKGKLGKIPNSHKDGLNISKSEHTLPKNESKHMVFRTLLFDVTSKQSLPLNASGLSKSAHDQQNKRFGHIYKYVPLFRSESKSKSRLSFITKFGFGAHPKANVCVGTERIPISRRGSGPYLVKPPEMKKRVNIRIKYITSPNASALQWLLPSQTKGKQDPFLFSQCQPIHARSILPCQDTPAVKFTYDAEVSAPTSFTVLMSALRENSTDGIAKFRQPVPIPSYLLAIAVGMLESKPLGPRSLVWAEKAELDRSVWEFGETEKYLQAAERLCGPYVWGQYDLLVLPPSFPYGGMENPCLTFVTPTLLAGDRSLADVIVHEIMHSWTGNLVTNKNFEHFWLNEGFTVFLERKVHASLVEDKHESKMSRDFASILGLQELTETVNVDLGAENPLTSLVVDLKGVHPDEAFSTVPYEKGSLFLRYLEDMLGGPEVFDPFLRAYLVQYTRKSLNTDEFKAFLLSYFPGNTALQGVDWNSWLYQPGMPPVVPNYDTTKVTQVEHLRKKVTNGDYVPASEDVKQFSVHQMIYLLQMLVDGPPLLRHQLAKLGQAYKIENSSNAEITYRWLRLCAKSRDTTKVNAIFDFINTVGRMKYVRPLYRDLYEWPDVRESAIENFKKNEPFMMHVTAYTLRKDLHLS